MRTRDVPNSKVLKRFVKGSLVIIGLFAVLFCGIAALVLYSTEKFTDNTFILILVFASLPITVFFGFLFFAKSYFKKLFGSLGIKYEEIHHKVHKIKKMLRECPLAAKTIKPDLEKCCEELKKQLEGISEQLSKIEEKGRSPENKPSNDGGGKDESKSDLEKCCKELKNQLKDVSEECRTAIKATKTDSENCCVELQNRLKEISEQLSEIKKKVDSLENQTLSAGDDSVPDKDKS